MRAVGSGRGRDRLRSPVPNCGPRPAVRAAAASGRDTMCGMAAPIPLWADQLEAEERAALRPGIPCPLDPRPDVLVVGGGVQGPAPPVACPQMGLARRPPIY